MEPTNIENCYGKLEVRKWSVFFFFWWGTLSKALRGRQLLETTERLFCLSVSFQNNGSSKENRLNATRNNRMLLSVFRRWKRTIERTKGNSFIWGKQAKQWNFMLITLGIRLESFIMNVFVLFSSSIKVGIIVLVGSYLYAFEIRAFGCFFPLQTIQLCGLTTDKS